MASALPADPERVPYYLLLVGGPESIPFRFQYQLDVQYAVGRIAFDTVDEYRSYAEAVVARERVDGPRSVHLFGPTHPADRATQLSSRLIGSLHDDLHTTPGYDVQRTLADDATKDALTELVATEAGLLFTASHGIGFPHGDRRQREAQGALVCQDWPGPLLADGDLADRTYFAGADVERLAGVGSRIMMSFACYGAGTPTRTTSPAATAPSAPSSPTSPSWPGCPSASSLTAAAVRSRSWGTWSGRGHAPSVQAGRASRTTPSATRSGRS